MKMKYCTFTIIAIAALITAAIGMKIMDGAIFLTSLGFIGWALTPYAYMAVMVKKVTVKSSIIAVLITAIIIGGLGVAMLIDIVFIHPDAQGGLAFVFTPLWQWILLVISTLPVYLLNKRYSVAE